MSMNIKKQAPVSLLLSAIGGLCPLQAMEGNQGQDFKWGLAQAFANSLLDREGTQQVMEVEKIHDNSFPEAFFPSLDHSSSAKKRKREEGESSNPDKKKAKMEMKNSFLEIVPEIKDLILFDSFYEENSINERLGELSLVCKEWGAIIEDRFKFIEDHWKTHYGLLETEYQLLKTMKIQYRPNPKSEEGMITLKIPAFANPLGHKFNLSGCGDAGENLSISTGYRTGMNPENKDKIELWVAPRKVLEKHPTSYADNYNHIIAHWGDDAPIGIFFTAGNWTKNLWCDYVINCSPSKISTKNCLQLLNETGYTPLLFLKRHFARTQQSQNFQFYFEPK